MSESRFMQVFSKRTGAPHYIPVHWWGTHLAKPFRKTPPNDPDQPTKQTPKPGTKAGEGE